MSREVHIHSRVTIQNMEIAQQVLQAFNSSHISIANNHFVIQGFDWSDGRDFNLELQKIELLYRNEYAAYCERLAEEERQRIEAEKEKLRQEKRQLALEIAKKQGYQIKKETTENNVIRITLEKRVYE